MDIGVGGRVHGDCIQCPFHNWRFSGLTGQCIDVPYARSTIPEQAKLKTYICLERNKLVMMWYHADPAVLPPPFSEGGIQQGP